MKIVNILLLIYYINMSSNILLLKHILVLLNKVIKLYRTCLVIVCLNVIVHGTFADRTAFINFQRSQSNSEFSESTNDNDSDVVFQVSGTFGSIGAVRGANGDLYSLSSKACEEEKDFSEELSENWIGLFHHPLDSSIATQNANCQTVVERVQKAMMFGASAIIILVLQPKVFTELDKSQLFSRPVVIIENVTHVGSVLNAIWRKFKYQVKITYNATFYELQRVSPWSMCDRLRPGSDIICITTDQSSQMTKTDPGHLWNYFYSILATIIFMIMLKARNYQEDQDHIEQTLRRVAQRTLCMMQKRKYKIQRRRKVNQEEGEERDRETCAICLDCFYPRQNIRTLPCQHEFHAKCVDRWLIAKRTCPLCKLNILDLDNQQNGL